MARLTKADLDYQLGFDYWEKISKFIWNCEKLNLTEFSTCHLMDSCGWKGRSKAVNQVLRNIEFIGKIKGFKKEHYCWWEIING